MLRRFAKDTAGNFAVFTALAAVPLVGITGVGLDYARASSARSVLQDRADEAVMAIARQGPTGTDTIIFNQIKASISNDTPLSDITVSGSWVLNEYTVNITGKLPLTLTKVLSASNGSMNVAAQSTGRYRKAQLIYQPPTKTFLDPEAGDYNRVYAYCFNKDQKNNPTTHGRSKMTAIGDNGNTTYQDPMPVCASGETMSFQLYNARGARSAPSDWDKASTEHYSYYTDTEYQKQNGQDVEKYDLGGWSILETVLCPTLDVCKPKSQGGILPEGKNRTPQHATQSCAPGMFMYYGWEDRPPGNGWTDQDYDDIRIIIECPTYKTDGSDVVRLIK